MAAAAVEAETPAAFATSFKVTFAIALSFKPEYLPFKIGSITVERQPNSQRNDYFRISNGRKMKTMVR
jgi:hypothetical protein